MGRNIITIAPVGSDPMKINPTLQGPAGIETLAANGVTPLSIMRPARSISAPYPCKVQ